MRLRTFLLSFALTNLCFNSIEYGVTAQSEVRPAVLSADDMMRVLPGNTLLAYDKSGPFWMYFPKPGTVWGHRAAGKRLASYDQHHLLWMDGAKSRSPFASMLSPLPRSGLLQSLTVEY